jgi:exosortase/archaeosortase
VLTIPVNLLTNVLTLEEKIIWQILWWVVWGLMAWEFFRVVRDTHNFEFGQAFMVSLLSLVGIVAVWILVGLVYALSAEIFRFIGQIVLEIYVHLY